MFSTFDKYYNSFFENHSSIPENDVFGNFLDKFLNLLDDYIVNDRIKYIFYFLFIYFFIFEFMEIFFSLFEFFQLVGRASITDSDYYYFSLNEEYLFFISYISDLSNIFYSNETLSNIFGIGYYVIEFFDYLLYEEVWMLVPLISLLYMQLEPNIFANSFYTLKNNVIYFQYVILFNLIISYISFLSGLEQDVSYSLFIALFSLFFCAYNEEQDKFTFIEYCRFLFYAILFVEIVINIIFFSYIPRGLFLLIIILCYDFPKEEMTDKKMILTDSYSLVLCTLIGFVIYDVFLFLYLA